jgi:hypothetical protein
LAARHRVAPYPPPVTPRLLFASLDRVEDQK